MQMTCARLALMACFLMISTFATSEEPRRIIPPAHGETLSGAAVDLPASLQGEPGVLVFGFSQDAREAVGLWGKKLFDGCSGSPSNPHYEVAMLASAPRMLRGMIESRMKAGVPAAGLAHFLVLADHEPEWRALTHYSATPTAYVLLIDSRGAVRWQTQGPPTDALCGVLKEQLEQARRPATIPLK